MYNMYIYTCFFMGVEDVTAALKKQRQASSSKQGNIEVLAPPTQ